MSKNGATAAVWYCAMAAGILAGLAGPPAYLPLVALAAVGAVWYAVDRREPPRPAVGYAMLGACALLGAAGYAAIKGAVLGADIAGIICTAAGLCALAAVSRWALPRTRGRPEGRAAYPAA